MRPDSFLSMRNHLINEKNEARIDYLTNQLDPAVKMRYMQAKYAEEQFLARARMGLGRLGEGASPEAGSNVQIP